MDAQWLGEKHAVGNFPCGKWKILSYRDEGLGKAMEAIIIVSLTMRLNSF